MFELIALALSGAGAFFGYVKSRQFVRGRLRYVDNVQKPVAPVVAGTVAAVAAAPVVWALPIVGTGAALAFGIAVGLGTRAGVRDIQTGKGGAHLD